MIVVNIFLVRYLVEWNKPSANINTYIKYNSDINTGWIDFCKFSDWLVMPDDLEMNVMFNT